MRQLEYLTGIRSISANILVLVSILLITVCLIGLSSHIISDPNVLAYKY